MEYSVSTVKGTPDWDNIERAYIKNYRWEKGYEPTAFGQLSLGEDELFFRLVCFEENPRVTYTEPQSPVKNDSCIELFFSINDCEQYINLEFNAGGCYLCGIGKDRFDRPRIDVFGENKPKGTIHKDFWEVSGSVSFKVLSEYFGVDSIKSMRGNFFKCGEMTEFTHFGMWSECVSEKPNFHLPEFFREFKLQEPVKLK